MSDSLSCRRVLHIALEGNADYLITGDEDLLVLNPFHKIKIVRPKDFEKIIEKFGDK